MLQVEDWARNSVRNGWLLFALVMLVQTSANIAVDVIALDPAERSEPFWRLATYELSSALLVVLLLGPLLLADSLFPLRREVFVRHLGIHLLITVPWSLLHVVGMVLVRKAVFAWQGESYDFGQWGREFLYEYLKDVRSYFTILSLVYLYAFVIRRLQGEASFVPEQHLEQNQPQSERFLVKMLGKEFLVKIEDIDWIGSAGNYVALHVGAREYLLRETMAKLENRLADSGFIRVHRSAIINLDRLDHIEVFDSGDAQAYLSSGHRVPVSRTHRQKLKQRLA